MPHPIPFHPRLFLLPGSRLLSDVYPELEPRLGPGLGVRGRAPRKTNPLGGHLECDSWMPTLSLSLMDQVGFCVFSLVVSGVQWH